MEEMVTVYLLCKDGPVFTCDELDEMPDEY